MMKATLFFLCAALVATAQNSAPPVFACNLNAIKASERPHYNDLTKKLQRAGRDRTELPDGYAFTLDGKAISLPEVAEWISLERLCCPFLTLQISASGNQNNWVLKLTGPEGVKVFLKSEFS